MILGKGDRGRDDAQRLVGLERPWRAQIPPGEAVEEVVEASAGRRGGFVEGAAERLGGEERAAVARLGAADQMTPHVGRHLVGGVAAKAPDAKRLEPRDVAVPIPEQEFLGGRLAVAQLREVAPHRDDRGIVGIDREGGADAALLVAIVDVRALRDEPRVVCRVIDDEVGHDLQAVRGRVLGEGADLAVVVARIGVAEPRIEAEGVADGVERARAAGFVERVDVDPVEIHRRDARQLGAPGRDRADEQREQVVDAGS